MKLNQSQIKALAERLNERLAGRHIAHPCFYCSDFIFFKLSGKGEKNLNICLDNTRPHLYLSMDERTSLTIETPFFGQLKKELSNAYVKTVKIVNDDRIIEFDCEIIDSVFKNATRIVYIELIPGKANMVVCDENGIVICAYKTGAVSDSRPLVKGLRYAFPLKSGFALGDTTPFDYESYVGDCLRLEPEYASRRKNEKFASFHAYLLTKSKSVRRKIKAIETDIAQARTHLADGDYGTYIFMNEGEVDPRCGFMTVGKKKIALDPSRSAHNNAEAFFRRAKKAKMTLSVGQDNLARAGKEQREYDLALALYEQSDEAGLEEAAQEFGIGGNAAPKKKTRGQEPLFGKENLPYAVDYHGTKILFGRNARQNDCLSFLIDTSKNHMWLHIDEHTGAHIMIKKDNATEDEILTAAEMCVLCSKLEVGSVVYTLRGNVRKGHVPGEALLKTYGKIKINSIRSSTRDLLKTAKRLELSRSETI